MKQRSIPLSKLILYSWLQESFLTTENYDPQFLRSLPKLYHGAVIPFLNDFKDHSEVIDIGQFLEEDGRIHFFQFANQMVYFDNILEFLGAAQFESFSLRFNLCFGTSTRDLASLFKLQGTRVGDGSSEDCKSSILIQSSKNPFKQLDLGDELPFIELGMGYNHILQVNERDQKYFDLL